MILRPGPRESWLDRFPIRGFLLFLMLSSTGIFVTSIWKLHLVSGTSYRITEISNVPEGAIRSAFLPADLDTLKQDLTGVIHNENEHLLHQILERIQYLSNVAPGEYKPGKLINVPVTQNETALTMNQSEPLAELFSQYSRNVGRQFWDHNWRDVLDLDDNAREYLEGYEKYCENRDSAKEVYARRRSKETEINMPLCPCVPATLIGRQHPDTEKLLNLNWKMTNFLSKSVMLGGYWKPLDCVARRRIAVIIPCRDRETQLRAFLVHMHPLLQRQLVEYRIFVVEQTYPSIYNKASSMNAGFLDATKMFSFDCVMFHDVDLLAEDDRSIIYCGEKPLHYGAHLDKWNYNVGYARIFGGAVSLTREQFVKANGFSNVYFGWGGEDDEFDKRVRAAGYEIERPPPEVSKHSTLTHKRDQANPVNPGSSRSWVNQPEAYAQEGLNTISFETTNIILEPLYTWIKIKLKLSPETQHLAQEPYQYFEVHGSCGSYDQDDMVIDELALSVTSCRYQCDIEPHCRAYVYRHEVDDHCVRLYKLCKIDQTATDASLFIKAVNDSETRYVMSPGDCHGNDIQGLTISLKGCIEHCDNRTDCAGFVYGELLSLPCWLKNDTCIETRPTVLGVKSYRKESFTVPLS